MMTDAEYTGWAELHCVATAATPEAALSLLNPVVRQAFDGMRATLTELGECTARLVRGLRVPTFANEHATAVLRELRALRDERAAAQRPDHSEAYYEQPRCPLCGGDGLVSVPHPKCIWQGRLVCYPGTHAVLSGAVLCDALECVKGREVRGKESSREKPRPTYGDYCRRFGGLDLAGMLRDYERESAARVRLQPEAFPQNGVSEATRRLRERAAGIDPDGDRTGGVL